MFRILVIDDDKLICWSLKELLSQHDYDVDVALSASEALARVADCNYDLILADCEIKSEDGFMMLKELRSSQPESKMIILSALSPDQIQPHVPGLKIHSILEKPFRLNQIIAVVSKALGSKLSDSETENHIKSTKSKGGSNL